MSTLSPWKDHAQSKISVKKTFCLSQEKTFKWPLSWSIDVVFFVNKDTPPMQSGWCQHDRKAIERGGC